MPNHGIVGLSQFLAEVFEELEGLSRSSPNLGPHPEARTAPRKQTQSEEAPGSWRAAKASSRSQFSVLSKLLRAP